MKDHPVFNFPVHVTKGKQKDSKIYTDLAFLPSGMGVYKLTETNLNMSYVGSSVNVRTRCLGYFFPNSTEYIKLLFFNVNPQYLKIELLESVTDFELLREREQYWIVKLNTFYPSGLNINNPTNKKNLCDRTAYYSYKESLVNVGACWHLSNYINRFLYFLENSNSTAHDNKPLIKVGQKIAVGAISLFECTDIQPIEQHYIGPPIDNKYTLKSNRTGRIITAKNNDIKTYLKIYNK